jgi:phosphatidate phosphatase PAH1
MPAKNGLYRANEINPTFTRTMWERVPGKSRQYQLASNPVIKISYRTYITLYRIHNKAGGWKRQSFTSLIPLFIQLDSLPDNTNAYIVAHGIPFYFSEGDENVDQVATWTAVQPNRRIRNINKADVEAAMNTKFITWDSVDLIWKTV